MSQARFSKNRIGTILRAAAPSRSLHAGLVEDLFPSSLRGHPLITPNNIISLIIYKVLFGGFRAIEKCV
jgi:hypothetical protein